MPKKLRNPHPIAIAKRRASMTYEQIAARCGFSHGYLRQIASGVRKPSFSIADAIASVLAHGESARNRLAMKIMRFPYRMAA